MKDLLMVSWFQFALKILIVPYYPKNKTHSTSNPTSTSLGAECSIDGTKSHGEQSRAARSEQATTSSSLPLERKQADTKISPKISISEIVLDGGAAAESAVELLRHLGTRTVTHPGPATAPIREHSRRRSTHVSALPPVANPSRGGAQNERREPR